MLKVANEKTRTKTKNGSKDARYTLIFEETEFPKASDFDEPPADPYDHSRSSQPTPEPNWPIYDEIIVQPPPALEVFATYGPEFQQDSDPQSFTDAMRRPDHKLWWEAFCVEICAIIPP